MSSKPEPQGVTLVIYSLRCGGAEKVLATMANSWVNAGRPVTVITMANPDQDFFSLDDRVKRIALNLAAPAHSIAQFLMKRIRRWRWMRAALRQAGNRQVIAFTPNISNLVLMASVGLSRRVTVVERNDPILKKIGPVSRLLRVLLYPRAAKVVVQTQRAMRNWGGGLRKKMVVIPNPITPSRAATVEAEWPQPFILGVGRLYPVKQFDHLLHVFSNLADEFPDWHLVIAGEGPERAKLEATVAETPAIQGRVSLPGVVSPVDPLYDKAGVFVLASRHEGFPNVLLEAMYHRCPVVSYDCPNGPDELIEDSVSGFLVTPDDRHALESRIRMLLDNEELRQRIGRAAGKSADRFSLPSVMKKWDVLLDE